jgi:hypothetical protein
MRPFDKFKEIDARLAALEAALLALHAEVAWLRLPNENTGQGPSISLGRWPQEAIGNAQIIDGPVKVFEAVELRQAIDNTEPIVLATVAPPPAKRRGRPPKTA